MAVTLGAVTFDDAHTTVSEKLEEVGGRDERSIEISGLVVGESSIEAIEAALDTIVNAASKEDYSAELSVRPGRCLRVRRDAFKREVARDSLVGSFVLTLAARDPFEVSVEETSEDWSVTESGDTKEFTTAGNVYAKPRITIEATGDIVDPSFGDGTRIISYSGIVEQGLTLVFDGATEKVTVNGQDVTAYTTGEFPRISPPGTGGSPEETTLTYTDGPSSSHAASVTVAFRDRWW